MLASRLLLAAALILAFLTCWIFLPAPNRPLLALGVGAPFGDDAQYERALTFAGEVLDDVAQDPAHRPGGLIDLLAGTS